MARIMMAVGKAYRPPSPQSHRRTGRPRPSDGNRLPLPGWRSQLSRRLAQGHGQPAAPIAAGVRRAHQ
eukprot:1861713-Rhodomonas_salina.2